MIEVTLIDKMGTDLTAVNAARVSFGKTSEMEGGQLSPKDTRLINYLATHEHYSPFGHAAMSFHVKAPIFVARQLVKHKFLRWNEISRRYVDDEPEFYLPDTWRGRVKDKKQGSEGEAYTRVTEWQLFGYSLDTYKELLADGVCPEQARMVLPQSTMTEWWWTGSLDAFANMCNLRLKKDTQYESRLVAQQVDKIASDLFPVSWRALVNEG